MRTDHKPLCEVLMKKRIDAVSSRITKWIIALQEFDFDVRYIQELRMGWSILSRLVNTTNDEVSCDCESEDDFQVCSINEDCHQG